MKFSPFIGLTINDWALYFSQMFHSIAANDSFSTFAVCPRLRTIKNTISRNIVVYIFVLKICCKQSLIWNIFLIFCLLVVFLTKFLFSRYSSELWSTLNIKLLYSSERYVLNKSVGLVHNLYFAANITYSFLYSLNLLIPLSSRLL